MVGMNFAMPDASALSSTGAVQTIGGVASFLRERADRFDRHLHLLVAEHDGAEHDVFG